MKRSNSTGMITDLLSVTEREGQTGRRNSIGTGLKGKRLLSASNASLPGDVTLCLPWTSPVKLQVLRTLFCAFDLKLFLSYFMYFCHSLCVLLCVRLVCFFNQSFFQYDRFVNEGVT